MRHSNPASMQLESTMTDVGIGTVLTVRTSIHCPSLTRTSFRLASLADVHRATAAIPPLMPLSRSISTSMPIPYAGTRALDVFEKWLVWLTTKPIPPRVQSLADAAIGLFSRKGLSSGLSSRRVAFLGVLVGEEVAEMLSVSSSTLAFPLFLKRVEADALGVLSRKGFSSLSSTAFLGVFLDGDFAGVLTMNGFSSASATAEAFFGVALDGDSSTRNGFFSPLVPWGVATAASVTGGAFPSHSHSQQSLCRSLMSNFVVKPWYVASVRWLSTLRTIPVSSEGATAHVAKACDSACCRAVWILYRRDKWGGRGISSGFTFRRVDEAGGVGGLHHERQRVYLYPRRV